MEQLEEGKNSPADPQINLSMEDFINHFASRLSPEVPARDRSPVQRENLPDGAHQFLAEKSRGCDDGNISVRLPEDFVASGGFDDLCTESEGGDEVTKIAAGNAIREYLDFLKRLVAAKRGKKTEDEDDEEEDDGEGDEGEEDGEDDEEYKDDEGDMFEGFD